MAYFPFMIEVEGHKALVVGAGQSAKDKIRALTDFGAVVTVVAPVISADVVKQGKNIRIERRVYRPGETKGYEIVVAATDNAAVNKQVAHDAARFGAICSVSGDPGRGGFIFPQIIKRSTYSVAVCADGMDADLAAKLRDKIADAVPEKADEIAALFSKARKKLDDADGVGRTRLADIAARENDEPEYQASDKGQEITADDDTFNEEDKEELRQEEEGEVIRIGALSGRLSQVRADAVISRLEEEGYRCSKVMLECPGAAENTTIMNAGEALENYKIDIGVVDAGRIPEDIPETVSIIACLPREDARDVLVTKKGTGDNEVEVIETDCASRKAQIEKFLRTGEARVSSEGIQVIVNHLKADEADAAVLAASDLERLLMTDDDELDCEYIDVEKSLPPACQGITALMTRNTGKAHDAAAELSDNDAMTSMKAERHFMAVAGISPDDEAAAYSAMNGGMLFMKVMHRAGQKCVYFAGMGDPAAPEDLAEKLAAKFG